jgi:NDP-sugar pyrophosphorylase family protein
VIPVLIQAGGEGARLRPYTMVLPKPLLPIIDTPIIEIVLRQLRHQGFRDTHISIGHLGHLLQAVLGDGERFGMNLHYVVEDQPLGTIGPLRQLPRPNGPVLVMNGDLLTDLDYVDLVEHHTSADADLTIGICRCPVPVSLGVIDFDDECRIVGFREKPTLHYWASTGIYVLGPRVWDLIPTNKFFGFDALMERVLAGSLHAEAYHFDGLWLDIGRPEDHGRAAEVFEKNRQRLLPPDPSHVKDRPE